ncbi:MAG: DnaJ C-terminal domain-containing protein, partial [Bilophila sp.]
SPDGGQKGDLYLKIRFAPHPLFQVEGNDLIHEVQLDPWQAVLGAKVLIPTLEGSVELSVPAGTSSGRKMRLRGKGLGAGADRGDEYVRVGIKSPLNLTDKQRKLWEDLAAEGAL